MNGEEKGRAREERPWQFILGWSIISNATPRTFFIYDNKTYCCKMRYINFEIHHNCFSAGLCPDLLEEGFRIKLKIREKLTKLSLWVWCTASSGHSVLYTKVMYDIAIYLTPLTSVYRQGTWHWGRSRRRYRLIDGPCTAALVPASST